MEPLNQPITDVSRNFSDYVNRCYYGGESFILVRGGKPVAELKALPVGRKVRDLPQLLASLPKLDETDQILYVQDIEEMRRSVAEEPENPWDV